MITLNLADPQNSEIQFEHRKYPEGQQDIILDRIDMRKDIPIIIKSRFTNWRDLELIVAATKALRNLRIKEIHLFIPYILGARSDRKFQEGGTSYLRDVVAPVINQLEFESVTVIDPHSDVVEAVIKNIEKVDNVFLVQDALSIMASKVVPNIKQYKYVLVSPDAGAMKKIYNVAEKINAESIIIASKHREIKTGKILSTEVNIGDEDINKDMILIDDICDGGRTFIELAKALRLQGAIGRLYLIVTHGIFSAGLYELSKHFDQIFTTNSISNIEVESHSDYTVNKDFIQQFDVFNYLW